MPTIAVTSPSLESRPVTTQIANLLAFNALSKTAYVIVDGEPLYDRGITNEHHANDVFNNLSRDIHLYIKKR